MEFRRQQQEARQQARQQQHQAAAEAAAAAAAAAARAGGADDEEQEEQEEAAPEVFSNYSASALHRYCASMQVPVRGRVHPGDISEAASLRCGETSAEKKKRKKEASTSRS